jgi:hypothetical protein
MDFEDVSCICFENMGRNSVELKIALAKQQSLSGQCSLFRIISSCRLSRTEYKKIYYVYYFV